MGFWAELRERWSTVADVFALARERKRWWLLPLMALLIVVGALLFFISQSPVAPFLYTVF